MTRGLTAKPIQRTPGPGYCPGTGRPPAGRNGAARPASTMSYAESGVSPQKTSTAPRSACDFSVDRNWSPRFSRYVALTSMPVCSSKVLRTGPAMRRGASTYTTTVPWRGISTRSSSGRFSAPGPQAKCAAAARRTAGCIARLALLTIGAGTVAARRPAHQAPLHSMPLPLFRRRALRESDRGSRRCTTVPLARHVPPVAPERARWGCSRAGNALECPHEPSEGAVAYHRSGGARGDRRDRPGPATRCPQVQFPPPGRQLLLLEVRGLVQPLGLLLPSLQRDLLRVHRLRPGSEQPEGQQGSFPFDQAPGPTTSLRPLRRSPLWI